MGRRDGYLTQEEEEEEAPFLI